MRASDQETLLPPSATLQRKRHAFAAQRSTVRGEWRPNLVGLVIACVLLIGLVVFWP